MRNLFTSLIFFLVACVGLQGVACAAYSEKRMQRRAAIEDAKVEVKQKKKIMLMLKKISDDKSARKVIPKLLEMFDEVLVAGEETAMGRAELADDDPDDPDLVEELRNRRHQIDDFNASIEKERSRIEKLKLQDENIKELMERMDYAKERAAAKEEVNNRAMEQAADKGHKAGKKQEEKVPEKSKLEKAIETSTEIDEVDLGI